MPDPALFALTWRVTRRRVLASAPAIAAGLAFPAFIVWIGLAHSYGTAAKLFYFLLPYAFLIAAQDSVRADLDSGALENALFAGGRFRDFLRTRAIIMAAAAGAYALALFGLFAAWGLAAGGFRATDLIRLGLAFVAGFYYVALAGVLGHFVGGGANVLSLLLAQAGAVLVILFTTSTRTGLLDHAASGSFPGLGPKLLFAGLAALVPNVTVAGRPSPFAAEVAFLLLVIGVLWSRLIRGLEVRGGRGS
ncbi:MAG TPA: hypothetical protein VLJ16_11465 [Acidobacteriota bacterium]|nr:hypothetical protein [Acidobacteriota bacterium]